MKTSDKSKLIFPDGTEMDIPPEGSLGFLALGYIGLQVWRQARKEAGVPSHWQKSETKEPNND